MNNFGNSGAYERTSITLRRVSFVIPYFFSFSFYNRIRKVGIRDSFNCPTRSPSSTQSLQATKCQDRQQQQKLTKKYDKKAVHYFGDGTTVWMIVQFFIYLFHSNRTPDTSSFHT